MKKTKFEKGITLIALIISIIVLLILAVVTMGAVKESAIIGHAQRASTDYKVGQEEEQIRLGHSAYKLASFKNPNALLEVEGAKSVNGDEKRGWIIEFESGETYKLNPNGTIVYEPVINENPDDWDIAFIHNGTSWEETSIDKVDITAEEEQKLENAEIVAKFYARTVAEGITPGSLPLNPSKPITFPTSTTAYTLYIEGTGDMGTLVTFDNENLPTGAYGYQIGVGALLGAQTEEPFLMPYVTEIVVCDGITNIGSGAFAASTSLGKITISSTVQEIASHAFICSSVTDVVIPGSVTKIGTSAFEGAQIRNLVMQEGVKEIGARAFCFTNNIGKISLPNGLTTIGEYAFANCENVENIVIPDSVTTIGAEAFYFCDKLANVYIEYDPAVNQTNLTVGEDAFDGTSNLVVHVKSEAVMKALLGKIGDNNTTISTNYTWTTPEI